ncbi:MAG: DUF6497 family protein [Celeribacter sp.]|jgi:hypothetical protein
MDWSKKLSRFTFDNRSASACAMFLGALAVVMVLPAVARADAPVSPAPIAALQPGQEVGPLPSGQTVTFLDRFIEPQTGLAETWLTLRFLAPRIARAGGDVDFDSASLDLDALCDGSGRQETARIVADGTQIDQVVIAMLDQPVARGESNVDATSYYGAYQPHESGCIWQ